MFDLTLIAAVAAYLLFLFVLAKFGEGSTDSNTPMALGVPAITIGGGGRGRDAHALTENFDVTDAWMGTQHALLLTVALAQK